MEDRPVFMKEPEEGPYPIATEGSLDSGSQLGDKEDEVRTFLKLLFRLSHYMYYSIPLRHNLKFWDFHWAD